MASKQNAQPRATETQWFCQICKKQCRDANGFKCHTNSELHVRKALEVGENAGQHISQYSQSFERDFLRLLRLLHGEKFISANHFYQQFIKDEDHIHMTATRWHSLSDFVRHLGEQGLVHVKSDDKGGFEIACKENTSRAQNWKKAEERENRAIVSDRIREERLLEVMVKRAEMEEVERDVHLRQSGVVAPMASTESVNQGGMSHSVDDVTSITAGDSNEALENPVRFKFKRKEGPDGKRRLKIIQVLRKFVCR